MNPTNLNDYYSSKGQALPSLQARAPIYQQYGLGGANTYAGTAAQNTALLAALTKGSATPSYTGSTPALTQAQLDAQNKASGTSQFNTGPARVGGSIGTTDPSTPPPSDSTPPPPNYEQSIVSGLTPSDEENRIQSQMAALDNTGRMLNEGEKAQDLTTRNQPIALDFITGQQKALAERYSNERTVNEAQKQTLQQQLANAQAKRQSALDVNKFQLERQDKAKADAKAGAYTLNAGDSRYDASGKLLSSAPAKPSTSNPTGTIVSGGLTYTPQAQAEDSQALEKSRGADGYVDPTVYQNLYKAWINNKGSLEDFLKQYPPKNYINPANTWLPPYLMPAGAGRSI